MKKFTVKGHNLVRLNCDFNLHLVITRLIHNFKTTEWLQGHLSLSPFQYWCNEYQECLVKSKLSARSGWRSFIYIYIYNYYFHYFKYIYIVMVCDHEINTSYTICRDKFLAFLHQLKFTKLYWTFNCKVWPNAWIWNRKNKRAKMLNKISSKT